MLKGNIKALRIVCIIVAVAALLILGYAALIMLVTWRTGAELSASVGVIGGADGPTAVFVSGPVPQWTSLLLVAAAGAAAIAYVVLTRKR